MLEEVLQVVKPEGAFFWATHTGAELDLLILKGGRRYGVEMKRQYAPRLTPSMRVALEDLALTRLTVLYPGARRYALTERIMVVPAAELADGRPEAVIASPRSGGRPR